MAGINGDDDSDNRYDKLIGVNCKQAIEIKQPAGGLALVTYLLPIQNLPIA